MRLFSEYDPSRRDFMFSAAAAAGGALVGAGAVKAAEVLRQPNALTIPGALGAFGGEISCSFLGSKISVPLLGDRITLSTPDILIKPDENNGWIFTDSTYNRPICLTSNGEIDGRRSNLTRLSKPDPDPILSRLMARTSSPAYFLKSEKTGKEDYWASFGSLRGDSFDIYHTDAPQGASDVDVHLEVRFDPGRVPRYDHIVPLTLSAKVESPAQTLYLEAFTLPNHPRKPVWLTETIYDASQQWDVEYSLVDRGKKVFIVADSSQKKNTYERVMKVIRGERQGTTVVYNENGQVDEFLPLVIEGMAVEGRTDTDWLFSYMIRLAKKYGNYGSNSLPAKLMQLFPQMMQKDSGTP